MPQLLLKPDSPAEELLRLMEEDARYEVADTPLTDGGCLPGLHSLRQIHGRQAPPKVPKVFLSNACTFNCAYCGCRAGNGERRRYCHQPMELARLAVEDAKRNGHGVFVTSAIYKNADYTEELIIETLRCMRQELDYQGYIHAKIMPGCEPLLIEQAGRYADRLSVNIEVAKSEGYGRIAKQKNRENILTPMRQISESIQAARERGRAGNRRFAVSQTTQLMAGSTGEDDRTILTLSRALYKTYRLKRVYYTPFHYTHPAAGYDGLPFVSTPAWRMRRLYQADRLQELYGFSPEEIAPDDAPFLSADLDPKESWALRHLELFPVEVNTADYPLLLRVPGIGVTYAKRIMEARRLGAVSHDSLRQIGVSLKKSRYFITCSGRYVGGGLLDAPERLRLLLASEDRTPADQLCFYT